MADTVETLAVRVKNLEDANVRSSEARGKIYARLEAVESGQAAISTDLSNIEKVCNEIKEDVKDLKERPAKRYEGVVNAVLQWAILALIGGLTIFK